jgi:hypothetical protein
VGDSKLSRRRPSGSKARTISSRCRRARPNLLLGACLVAIASLSTAASASAAPPAAVSAFGYSHQIGAAALSSGFTATSGVSVGLAVDGPANQVFVPSEASSAVEVFAGDGTATDGPVSSFGYGFLADVAVNQANGDVYVKSFGGGAQRFTSDRASTPTFTEVGFSPAIESLEGGLAIDPSSGDILVAETGLQRVRRFSSSGEFISQFSAPPNPTDIVVAPDGSIFVFETGVEAQNVVHYSSSGVPMGTIRPGLARTPAHIAFDPIQEELLMAVETSFQSGVFELVAFSASGEEVFSIPFPAGFGGSGSILRGIAFDAVSDTFYALTITPEAPGSPAGPASLLVFEQAWRPGLEAPGVSAITTEAAHVSAELDPGPGPPAASQARFEFSGDGGSTWNPTPYQPDGSGRIEADLEGLSPNVEYLVRVGASNAKGTFTSAASSFRTAPVPPLAVTEGATGIAESHATLNARIDPVGLQTTYRFEYGTTTSYGASVPFGPAAIAGGSHGSRLVEQLAAGLVSDTTYHYRVVAVNSAGSVSGADRTFTTLSAGSFPDRGYEQVTPVDHRGALLEPALGSFVGESEDAFSYMLRPSGALGESAPGTGRIVSARSATGWSTQSVDPPVNGNGALILQTTKGLSPDFSHAFVVTNRKLVPGALETDEGVNLYVTDLNTGTATLVASSEAPEALNLFTGLERQKTFRKVAPNLSWIDFVSLVPLGPEGVAGALYRWTETGGLEIASRLPDGSPTAVNGRTVQVSADGARIYFNDPFGVAYLRENGHTATISLFAGDPTAPTEGLIRGASRDGRVAFISSFLPLTPTAPESGEENLYRYDAEASELEYLGTALAGSGFEANFYGMTTDGSTAYFRGANGLEQWKRGGEVTLIAPGAPQTYTSPDGRYLAYFTAVSGKKVGDIHLYDSISGDDVCVSCLNGEVTGSAFLPEDEIWINEPRPTPVTNDGRLFFTTSAALVGEDSNGAQDVYEYTAGGGLALVSPGAAPFNAVLAAVSDDGSNVYFTTGEPLVTQDTNRALDIYDARVGGGIAAQSPTPTRSCAGENCQNGSEAQPAEATLGSEATGGSPAKASKKGNKGRCAKAPKRHAKPRPGRCAKHPPGHRGKHRKPHGAGRAGGAR